MNIDLGRTVPFLSNLPRPDHKSLIVLPVGGTSRVGMNCYAIGHASRWILIDVGATFAGADDSQAADIAEEHGGVLEQIVPDFRRIAGLFPRLDGIVLTHAHEDHIGALGALHRFSSLWPELARVPVYATPYTRLLAGAKIGEHAPRQDGRPVLPPLRRMTFRQPVRIGPFDIVPIPITHSAPETCALAIRTAAGTVVFASDMKLDEEPVLGSTTDTRSLEIFGAAGVLAFLGDSTNAVHSGRSASEGTVLKGLARLMEQHTGKVVISTFASNLARIASAARAARIGQRRLAASGRTIIRNVEAGIASGLLPQHGLGLVEPRILEPLPACRTALICTGSQAEQNSSLRRMADDIELGRRAKGFRLTSGDMLIHSGRVIPGNEATVAAMLDTFRSAGVQVITADDAPFPVHASGHGRRDELADMYRMLKPTFAIPVHGDRTLITAHADLARTCGVRQSLSPAEGEILRLSPEGMSLVGRIETGMLATISVGGRNSGETKLVDWTAGGKELAASSAPQARAARRTSREDLAIRP